MEDEIGKTEEVQNPKRVLSDEAKAKMKEGRIRALAARQGRKSKKDTAKAEWKKFFEKPPGDIPTFSGSAAEIRVPKKDLKFFGEGDKTKEGKIASEYPAHYFKAQIDELEENINKMEGRVARGLVPTSELPYATGAIRREKEKLDRIRQSESQTKGHEDALNKCQKEIGSVIREAMYNRTDGEKGLADPHEVAERWIKPCIEIPPEFRELATKANIPLTSDFKTHQIGAEKLWKLCRAGLGESTNTEILRRG